MKLNWRLKERLLEGLLNIPGLVLIITIWAFPLIVLVINSFYTNIPFGGHVQEFTLENYKKIFTDPFYVIILYRTAIIAITVTVLSVIISYPVAYKLARIDEKKAMFLLILIVVPFLTAVIFRAFGLIYLMGNRGVINSFLHWLGFEGISLIWNQTAIIIGFLNVLLPYMLLSLYSSIKQVNKSVEEAAWVLGANRVKTTWYIVLPQIKSGMVTGSIFVFAIAMGTFEIPAILGGMGQMVIPMLIQQYVSYMNFPGASALAIVLLGFVLLFVGIGTRLVGGKMEL